MRVSPHTLPQSHRPFVVPEAIQQPKRDEGVNDDGEDQRGDWEYHPNEQDYERSASHGLLLTGCRRPIPMCSELRTVLIARHDYISARGLGLVD
jgi:hypothetical protein